MKQPSQQPFGDAEALYAAAVGPEWKRYYRPRFLAFEAGHWRPQWNWAAALVPFWTAYRKIDAGVLVVLLFLYGTVSLTLWLEGFLDYIPALVIACVTVEVGLGVLQGLFGTWLVYRKARQDIRMLGRTREPVEVAAVLDKRAPRRSMAQDVVHGVVALTLGTVGFVMVSFGSSFIGHYDSHHRAALRNDLRNLVTAQETFLRDSSRYAASMAELEARGFTASGQVALEPAGLAGWRATATLPAWPRGACLVFMGAVRDTAPGAVAGEPRCDRHRRNH